MKLVNYRPTPLFVDGGRRYVNNAAQHPHRYRLAPADELKIAADIMLRVQARLWPQTTWICDQFNTTTAVLRWDNHRADNRLELCVDIFEEGGGILISLSSKFMPDICRLVIQGCDFETARQNWLRARSESMLCFWRLAPITETGNGKAQRHLGQLEIFRLVICGCAERLHMTLLDHSAGCLADRDRYFPDCFGLGQRPTQSMIVDDVVKVTQGFLIAAGIAR